MKGPFEIELKIHITNGDQKAVATYSCPVGELPTMKTISKATKEVLSEVKSQMGDGWRVLDRPEFENAILQDRTGTNMTFASKADWD